MQYDLQEQQVAFGPGPSSSLGLAPHAEPPLPFDANYNLSCYYPDSQSLVGDYHSASSHMPEIQRLAPVSTWEPAKVEILVWILVVQDVWTKNVGQWSQAVKSALLQDPLVCMCYKCLDGHILLSFLCSEDLGVSCCFPGQENIPIQSATDNCLAAATAKMDH